MRWFSGLNLAAFVGAGLIGCTPQTLEDADATGAISIVASTMTNPSAPSDPPVESGSADLVTGSVNGTGDYRLFALGAGLRGDEWEVYPDGPLASPLVVVLLDAQHNLLMRTYMTSGQPLLHVLRVDSEQVYLGVMPPVTGHGGSFSLQARLEANQSVPAPIQQVVYLDFDGGTNVYVHTRQATSFGPFDAAVIGSAYSDHTQEIKQIIVEQMQVDYADFDVVIISSDDGPPPPEPYSTVYFGGSEAGLLGLADNVDSYNQEPAQTAVVYVENFAPYWTMQLTPDEMAVMLANVASHELGHLLGLYHTQDPNGLMDTTGSAWDLAEDQSFIRGPLEPSVFATGWEDSPQLLAQTVGGKSGGAARSLAWQRPRVYKAIRCFVREELRSSCGTCLALDHE